jgi:hypothetical protein
MAGRTPQTRSTSFFTSKLIPIPMIKGIGMIHFISIFVLSLSFIIHYYPPRFILMPFFLLLYILLLSPPATHTYTPYLFKDIDSL